MENNYYTMLNRNTIEALRGDIAFFVNPNQVYMPIINNSLEKTPITGANYFNLMLSNSLNGTNHTEFVRMSDVLSSKIDWLSTLPPESRPRGIVVQEESSSQYPRYSFMMPTAQLNQNIFRDNQQNTAQRANYIPYQTNNATMSDFGAFIQEQCTNAINASLTNTTFKSNIPEQDMMQFKSLLVNEIIKNPEFMAEVANKAFQEVTNNHYLPFDRKTFIEKARNTESDEFKLLNNTITDHVNDMRQNQKESFNQEFNELSRPLINKIENTKPKKEPEEQIENVKPKKATSEKIDNTKPKKELDEQTDNTKPKKATKEQIDNTKPKKELNEQIESIKPRKTSSEQKANVEGTVTEFVKEKIKDEKTAEVLTDTFVGTFIERTQKLANIGKKVFAGVALACSVAKPILAQNFQPEDIANITSSLLMLRGLKGNPDLKMYMDNKDTRSFNTCLDKTIRENPQMLDKAISQLDKTNKQENTQTTSRSRK